MTGRTRYTVVRAKSPPRLDGEWDGGVWGEVEAAEVAHFHPRSSDHWPRTQVKLMYDDEGLCVHFRVEDRYVRAVHEGYQAKVFRDSCVEFFAQPKIECGYFNFEMSCGGSLLLCYVEPLEDGRKQMTPVDEAWQRRIEIFHSLPKRVDPEITEPVTWRVAYRAPWELFESHAGDVRPIAGTKWRGNFYKCADQSSHPHWGSWSPVGEKLDFHQPGCFGKLVFEG